MSQSHKYPRPFSLEAHPESVQSGNDIAAASNVLSSDSSAAEATDGIVEDARSLLKPRSLLQLAGSLMESEAKKKQRQLIANKTIEKVADNKRETMAIAAHTVRQAMKSKAETEALKDQIEHRQRTDEVTAMANRTLIEGTVRIFEDKNTQAQLLENKNIDPDIRAVIENEQAVLYHNAAQSLITRNLALRRDMTEE